MESNFGYGRASAVAVSSSANVLALGRNGDIELWDLQAGQFLRKLSVSQIPGDLRFSDNGTTLFGLGGRQVFSLNTLSGQMISTVRLEKDSRALDVQSDVVAVGLEDGSIEVFDSPLLSRHLTARAPHLYGERLLFVGLGRDGKELFGFADDGRAALWELGNSEPIRVDGASRTKGLAAGRDASGELLALALKQISLVRAGPAGMMAQGRSLVRIVEWRTGRTLGEYDFDSDEIQAVAITPARNAVLIGSLEGVRCIELSSMRRAFDVPVEGGVAAMRITSDGRFLVVLSGRGSVLLWRLSGAGRMSVAELQGGQDVLQASAKFRLAKGPKSGSLFASGALGPVALLRVQSVGTDSAFGDAITSVLGTTLATSGGVKLVERGAVDRVLAEQRFQNSGVTTTETAATIGRVLNAGKVLIGTVSKFGTSFVIDIRVVDTETAEVTGGESIECRNCVAEDLPEAVRILAAALVRATQ